MNLDELRDELIIKQKKGLPFISASIIIWFLITIVAALNIPITLKNILIFCCSTPMLPISWIIGKQIGINIFDKNNKLSELAFIFTMNQMLYLLIVMWVFTAVPEKMIMVYAIVFGAHLLPYSWVYKSKSYRIFAVVIPVLSLILGNVFNGVVVSGFLIIIEIVFVFALKYELKQMLLTLSKQ